MITVKIAGVPEHFNLPWLLAIENGDFSSQSIQLQWENVPEGTGKMCQMLRNNQTDLAVILTEGIVKDICVGNPSKIVQVYIQTPLVWGVHVAANSNFQTISDLKDKKIAISRIGSGSQLMACVNASNQNWKSDQLDFEIVNTIDGAVNALCDGKADYFLWEKFMTKPLVDKGIFRKIADCPTPWPCFVIAVTNEFLKKNAATVVKILEIINSRTFNFKQETNIATLLAQRYKIKLKDSQDWLAITEWSQHQLSEKELNKIQNQLLDFGIIDKKSTFAEIIAT